MHDGSPQALIRDAFIAFDLSRAAMLINEMSGFDPVFEVRAAMENPPPSGGIIWQVVSRSFGIIWVHPDTGGKVALSSLLTISLPLLFAYHRTGDVRPGLVVLNLGDADQVPGLAFCSFTPETTLVPDTYFMDTEAYALTRKAYRETGTPWRDRRPVAFWRGATTGQRPQAEWRSLPRVRLCEITRDSALFDVALSQVTQIRDPDIAAEIAASGLLRDHVPVNSFNRYRFHIDIDGNSNSWPGFFQKLLTGGPVLKVASERGYRQWYYDRLVPWENFVPVAADMSDLVEHTVWLMENDATAREIGAQGRALAESMDFPGELTRSAPAISNAIAAFSGPRPKGNGPVNPFGQPGSAADALMRRLHGCDIFAGFVPTFAVDLQGWNSDHPVFGEIISRIKPKVVIDVGVWKGASTLYLAGLARKHGDEPVVIAVDTFLGSAEHGIVNTPLFGSIPRRHGVPLLYEQFLSNVIHAGAQDHVIPLAQTSTAAAAIMQRAGVRANLIHIDASQAYEDVLRDARIYWDLLEPGGYLVGDDYDPTWPGVVQAATEFAAEKAVELEIRGPKWIVIKPSRPHDTDNGV
jgi:hypothetical protein